MKKNLKLIIFDISGTLIDHGSLVTVNSFIKTFKKFKIKINPELIIKDMGINKNAHINKIFREKDVISQLKKLKLKKKLIYKKICNNFNKVIFDEVKKKFDYIDGFDETIAFLRKNNILIALTTGYSRNILDYILNKFEKKKFYPDYSVSVSDVKKGRPHKDMIVKILKNLNVKKENALKIDDSFSGILEGKNANIDTLGLTLSGINLAINKTERDKTSVRKLNLMHKKISKKFKKIKTKYTLRDIKELKKFVKKIYTY